MQHMYTNLASMRGLLELHVDFKTPGIEDYVQIPRHESVSETVTKGTFSATILF